MSDLMQPETEKVFEHAVTLAAAFVASGQVHYIFGDHSYDKMTDKREMHQRNQMADLIHVMYGAVLQARQMVRADNQTGQ